jgi:hypothetical protein
MDNSLCQWLVSIKIHELDVELLLPAFTSERISSLADLTDVVADTELQQIVVEAQPISRVAAKRIERALKELSSASALPAAVNDTSAPSTPARVPLLDNEETPPPPPHVHKPTMPDRPTSRAT